VEKREASTQETTREFIEGGFESEKGETAETDE